MSRDDRASVGRHVVQQFIDSDMLTNTIEQDHMWTQLIQQIDTLNDDVERSIRQYEHSRDDRVIVSR